MTVMFMPSAACESWSKVEFLSAPRRVGLPAAAGGTAPVELARLEAAALAAIARQAPRVPVHQVPHQLEVAALVGRGGGDDLRLEQAVEPEERWIAPQLVAHHLVGLLMALGLERVLKHGVEQIERRVALEVAGEQAQALLGATAFDMRFVDALRREREIGRVLRFDPLPELDGALAVGGEALEVAREQARAHAFAVRLERRLEVPAGAVGARACHLGGGELAVVLRELARFGADLARERDGARPVLLLLVDLEQMRARRRRLRALLELGEYLLGAVEDAGLEVVLAELGERDHFLIVGQSGALKQVLVHADRPVVLAAPAKEAAEREVQL